ncbi:MAG: YifB family Mg chelatase-like AAA ATPase [Elusimicrobia bacterium]|nr:YifB family Mg chelatase-like AAA ATPase [Elusimicrobiota bacterium]
MFYCIKTLGFKGIEGFEVSAETDVSAGLPSYNIVGLPDAAVKESRDRVISALRNSGFKPPAKKITVNLAPAEMKKTGSHFDLPISLGILISCGILKPKIEMKNYFFLGELSLDGEIRPVSGMLPMLIFLKENYSSAVAVIPYENALEAKISKIDYLCAQNLSEVCSFLKEEKNLIKKECEIFNPVNSQTLDFSEVKGQAKAKRAAEIAAAGFHNLIMVGPPGSGKSMIAKRLFTIMPPLSEKEILETTRIYSVWNKGATMIGERPFREPHHSISDIALLGGGQNPRPGEVSLAHNGILFLDELPEFSRSALEGLREPLENKKITVARAKDCVTFPANFLLAAAANPCPCGYYSHPARECVCTPLAVQKYRNRLSGPLLDRIDLHVEVSPVKYSQWEAAGKEETSSEIGVRVIKAREIQNKRNGEGIYNSYLSGRKLREICALPREVSDILEKAMDAFGLSARSLDKAVKIARTIADLDGMEKIGKKHMAEALSFRSLDKRII